MGWPQAGHSYSGVTGLSAAVFPVKTPTGVRWGGREGHSGKIPHLREGTKGGCLLGAFGVVKAVCARQVDPSVVGSMAGRWMEPACKAKLAPVPLPGPRHS